MKKVIKLLMKQHKVSSVFFDGIFYMVIAGNKALSYRAINKGKNVVLAHKIIMA